MDRLATLTPSLLDIGRDLLKLGVAYGLAIPIGWEREEHSHSAGIRTFPIVAAAACGFTMLGTAVQGASPDSYSRMLQGLITGIGFIGGGAILRDKGGVTGTATAASIWSIGIAGAAVGLGFYHIAVVLTLINILTFRYLTPFKQRLDKRSENDTQDSGNPTD